jgi:hypothetical protein
MFNLYQLLAKKLPVFFLSMLLVTGGFLGVGVVPTITYAETSDEHGTTFCPIAGEVVVEMMNTGGSETVADVFYGQVAMTNTSAYVLGGVRIAVAAFESDSAEQPLYWTVLPETWQLLPGEELGVPVSFALDSMESGRYQLKTFAVQGEEADLLGAVLNQPITTRGVTIIKETASAQPVELTISVSNDGLESSASEPAYGLLTVSLQTHNQGDTPLVDSRVLGVLTHDVVPLGAAVVVDKLDTVKLIPNGVRKTKFVSPPVLTGRYTAYGALLSTNKLQPIVATELQTGDQSGLGAWAYFSIIGLSDYSLPVGGELVACIDYVGTTEEEVRFRTLTGAELVLMEKGQTVGRDKAYSTDQNQADYFQFESPQTLSNFRLQLNLLLGADNTIFIAGAEEDEVTHARDALLVVDQVVVQFTCAAGQKSCETKVTPISDDSSVPFNQTIWFYFGVTLASLLLLYMVLGRLPGKHPNLSHTNKLSADELQ